VLPDDLLVASTATSPVVFRKNPRGEYVPEQLVGVGSAVTMFDVYVYIGDDRQGRKLLVRDLLGLGLGLRLRILSEHINGTVAFADSRAVATTNKHRGCSCSCRGGGRRSRRWCCWCWGLEAKMSRSSRSSNSCRSRRVSLHKGLTIHVWFLIQRQR
jgi:hypothetical protein